MSNASYPQSSTILVEHRCNCGKLLFKGLILSSELEIKCKNCHAVNFIGKKSDAPPISFRYSILFNLNGNITDASDSVKTILGYSKEELISMKIQQVYPLLEISTYAHLADISTFLDLEPFAWDTLCQHQNGGFIPVKTHVRYVKDRQGVTLALFECVQIPGKQAVGAKQDTNNRCAFVSRINTSGILTYVSVKLATLLGFPPMEMLGKSLDTFYPKSANKSMEKVFSRHLASKESFKLSPHALFCKNQDTLAFESYFAADFDDRGQLRGFQVLSWLAP